VKIAVEIQAVEREQTDKQTNRVGLAESSAIRGRGKKEKKGMGRRLPAGEDGC